MFCGVVWHGGMTCLRRLRGAAQGLDTALIRAAERGDAECVRVLVAAGADKAATNRVRTVESFFTFHLESEDVYSCLLLITASRTSYTSLIPTRILLVSFAMCPTMFAFGWRRARIVCCGAGDTTE
jgi:hypothetical protein